jgi:hypothetical protein
MGTLLMVFDGYSIGGYYISGYWWLYWYYINGY